MDTQNILLERQEHISFKKKGFVFIKNTETQVREIYRHSTANNNVPYTTAKESSSSEAKILNAKLQVSVLDDKIEKEIEQLKQLRERILCMEKENNSRPRQQRQNLLANITSSEKVERTFQSNEQTPPLETPKPSSKFMTLGIKLLSTKEPERKLNSDAVESTFNNTPRLSAGCYYGGNYQSCNSPASPRRQHTCCYPAQNYCSQQQPTQGRINCSCFNSPPRVTPHQGSVYPSFDLQQRGSCPQQVHRPNIGVCCTERPICGRRATDLNTEVFCNYRRRAARDKDDSQALPHHHRRSKSPRRASKSPLNRRMHDKLKQDGVSDISSLEKYKVQSHEKTLKVTLVKQDQARGKDQTGLKKDKSETAKMHRQYMERYKTENERTAKRIEDTGSSGLETRPTYTKLRDSTGKSEDQQVKKTGQQRTIAKKPLRDGENERDSRRDSSGRKQDQPAKKEIAQQQKLGEKSGTANEKGRNLQADSSGKKQDQQAKETTQQQKIGEKPGTANEKGRDLQTDSSEKKQDQQAKETAQQQKIGETPGTAKEVERGPRTDSSGKKQDQQETETAQQQKIGEVTAIEKGRQLQTDSSGKKQDQQANETAQQQKIGEKQETGYEKERQPQSESFGNKQDQQSKDTVQQQKIGEKPVTVTEKERALLSDSAGKVQERQTKEGAQQQKSGENGQKQEMKEAPQNKQVREDQVRAYEKGRNLQPDPTEKREDQQATEATQRKQLSDKETLPSRSKDKSRETIVDDARLDTEKPYDKSLYGEPWDKYQRRQEMDRGSISSAKETGLSYDRGRQPDSGKSYARYGTSSVPNECMCNNSYLEQDGNKNSQLHVEQQQQLVHNSGQKSFYSVHQLPRQQDLYADLQRQNLATNEYAADQTFQTSCQCVQKQILGIYPQTASQGSAPIKQTQYSKRVVSSNCCCADNKVASKTRIQTEHIAFADNSKPTDWMSMDCQYSRQCHGKPTSASPCNSYLYVERNKTALNENYHDVTVVSYSSRQKPASSLSYSQTAAMNPPNKPAYTDPRICEGPSSSRSYNQRAAVDQPCAPYYQSQPAYTDPRICERPASSRSYNQIAAVDQPSAPYYQSQPAYSEPCICERPSSSRSYNQVAAVDQPSAPYYQSQPAYTDPRICERPASSRSYNQIAAVDQPSAPYYQSQPAYTDPRICESPASSRSYNQVAAVDQPSDPYYQSQPAYSETRSYIQNAAVSQPYTPYPSQPAYNDLRSCESPASSHTCMSQLAYTDPCPREMCSITFPDEEETDFASCDDSCRSSSSLNTDLTCREHEDGCDTCDDSRRLRLPTFEGCPCMFETYLSLATMCNSKKNNEEK